MSQKIDKSCLIASPLKTEPSTIDLANALGKDSKNFITRTSLRSYSLENLPPQEAIGILGGKMDFESTLNRIRDFFSSVTVLSETENEIWVPTWEIHRPKIEGCTATLQKASSTQTDYSLSIKIFGVGGGVTKSRSIGYKDSIEASGKCLQIRLPVKTVTQECITKNGIKFFRINVEDIGIVPSAFELTSDSDRCGLNLSKLKSSEWKTREIQVPAKTKQTTSLNIQSSQAAELTLTLTMPSVEIGPKAVIKVQKELEYSYVLVGAHKYIAYFPKNAIAYYWSIVT